MCTSRLKQCILTEAAQHAAHLIDIVTDTQTMHVLDIMSHHARIHSACVKGPIRKATKPHKTTVVNLLHSIAGWKTIRCEAQINLTSEINTSRRTSSSRWSNTNAHVCPLLPSWMSPKSQEPSIPSNCNSRAPHHSSCPQTMGIRKTQSITVARFQHLAHLAPRLAKYSGTLQSKDVKDMGKTQKMRGRGGGGAYQTETRITVCKCTTKWDDYRAPPNAHMSGVAHVHTCELTGLLLLQD